jgi:HlyD family secretion protein
MLQLMALFRIRYFLFLSAFFLWLLMSVLLTSCQEDPAYVKPTYQDLIEAVYSTVTVEPQDYYTVYPAVSGLITQSMVEEGDSVAVGTNLFQLDNSQPKISSDIARLSLETARETYRGDATILKEIAENISSARLRLKHDSLNFVQQQRLWQQNIGSQQLLDDRRLAYEVSRNDLDRLTNNYTRTQRDLERQLASARNSYTISTINQADFTVKSQRKGKVYAIFREIGEAVNPQIPLATIGSATDFVLLLKVDEVDISRVQVGQKVVVLLDAYGEEVFLARVTRISPSMDARSQTFAVEARFTQAPTQLYNGLTGEASIIIREKRKALVLPTAYISKNNEVHTDSGLVKVETGLTNLTFTEILAGVDTATVIYETAQ